MIVSPDYIYRNTKYGFKVAFQSYDQKKLRSHIDTNIHIAIRRLFITRHGAKQAQSLDAKVVPKNWRIGSYDVDIFVPGSYNAYMEYAAKIQQSADCQSRFGYLC